MTDLKTETGVPVTGPIYSSKFDIDSSNLYCDGEVNVEKAEGKLLLRVLSNGVKVIELDFADLEEFSIVAHIGCSSLEVTRKGGDPYRLCRFTQSRIKPMSEFIKACNYYIQTGQFTDIDLNKDFCPICGRRFIENSTICIHCVNKGTVFRRFVGYGKKYIPGFVLAALIVLLTNLVALVSPYLNRILVDTYLAPPEGSTLPDNPVRSVLLIVAGLLGLTLIQRFLGILSARIRNRTGGAFIDNLRVMLYNKVQLLSMSSVSRRTTGDLMKRVTDDTQTVKDFIQDNVLWFVETGTIFLGVSIYFIVTRPVLALMIFLPVPLVLFLAAKTRGLIHSRYEKQWILGARCSGILHDIVRGIRVVKVFGTEEREVAKYNRVEKNFADVCSKNEQLFAFLFPSLGFLVGIGEFLVLYYGSCAVLGTNIFGDQMTLGQLTQAMAYTGYIYGPLQWITSWPRALANALTSMAKVNEIIDEEPEIRDRPNALNPDIKGDISFHNVTFGYKSYEPVLKNINLDIHQGEMVGLVGHSGVGKSTLINLIMRLYDVSAGSITIDGVDIRDISRETLCNSIGTVFQETFLFAGSIYDNIRYAKPEATPEEVISAAKIANAHEFIVKLPDAYNTLVGENGYSLSGGERQRVAIARAVLRNPRILILDEATAALDTETESKIQEALARLIKGRTTIAIAHRLSTLRNADRLIVLEKGKVHEQGTHDELLKQKGIYYNLVMAQRQTNKMADNNNSD